MNEVKVEAFRKEHYQGALKVANLLFYEIMTGFSKLTMTENEQFLDDGDFFPKEETDGLYVITVDGTVAGVMKLSSTVYEKYESKGYSFWKMLRKYGFMNAIVLPSILEGLEPKLKEKELYVDFIVVDDSFRGLGLGTKLLKYGEELATQGNYETYTLKVLDSNQRAKKLYESLGFQEEKKESYPRFIQKRLGATCDYYMVKKIVNEK